jgi:hypothetical protein
VSLAGNVSTRVEPLWRNLRRLRAERGTLPDILFALGILRIVCGLHAHPDSGTVAKQFTQPNCYGRRYRFALPQNIVQMLAGDAEELRNFGLCSASGWNHILS